MGLIALDTLRGKVVGERLTMDEFADIIGMTRQSFSNKINGKNQFTASELVKMSIYFESKGKSYKIEEMLPEQINFFKSLSI